MKTYPFLSLKPIFLMIALLSHPLAYASNTAGYLDDFQYQVTNFLTIEEAQSAMRTEAKETRGNSICSNRATLWAYRMNQVKHIQVGKVFIHFTSLGTADENKAWSYHVAPYVLVNGEEMVLDRAFNTFHQKPALLSTWTNHFGKSKNCVVLDPLHNPAHLKLELNNLSSDYVNLLGDLSGSPRQYPATEGICYIRKVPMYYSYPNEVYGVDLYLSGQEKYSSFLKNSFNEKEVLHACKQATSAAFKKEHSCDEYLGIKQN